MQMVTASHTSRINDSDVQGSCRRSHAHIILADDHRRAQILEDFRNVSVGVSVRTAQETTWMACWKVWTEQGSGLSGCTAKVPHQSRLRNKYE